MRPFERLVSILLVSGLVLSQLGGCGRAPETPADSDGSGGGLALTGAGSTFAASFFEKLMEVYRVDHPDLRPSYEAVGSGEGTDRFLAGGVNIGATDAPLSADEAEGVAGGILQLQVTAGMIAITYNLPGIDLPGVFTLRWMDDTLRIHSFLEERLPKTAVIVGGGYIGMEMTESLTRRGIAVTVVEAMPSVMTTLDPDLGSGVGSELSLHGVEVRPGTTVERIIADGSTLRVQGNNGLDLSYTPPLSSPWDPVQMAAQAWVAAWRKTEATA